MKIIGFESSCDETAVAIAEIDESGRILPLASCVNSQIPLHRLYGGVVPEIAGRAHIENISPLTEEAFKQAGLTPADIDAVAVTANPGLIGALLVGVNFAKAFAFAQNVPLVAVDHMKAHIAAAYVHKDSTKAPKPPFIALAVSGGHTSLYLVSSYTDYKEIGATRDDAIGEAFDKVGRLLGLSYPAGAEFDKLAKEGFALACGKEDATFADYKKSAHFRVQDLRFPSPALSDGSLDFSFSGLKTAAVNLMHRFDQKGEQIERERFAAAYTYEAVEAVATHVKAALQAYEGYPLVVAGGVAANSHLRKRLGEVTAFLKRDLFIPPLSLCGDNALMVCAQGYHELEAGNLAGTDLNASASDSIM